MKECRYEMEGMGEVEAGNENIGEKGVEVDSRDQWSSGKREGEDGVLWYRVRAAALGRSLVQEGWVDGTSTG